MRQHIPEAEKLYKEIDEWFDERGHFRSDAPAWAKKKLQAANQLYEEDEQRELELMFKETRYGPGRFDDSHDSPN